MAQPTIQTSFASGEWAPKLRSRVDIQKYRAGAALLRNFYVDYAGGGASTRPGTRFINQCLQSGSAVRLIPFQPSANLSYILEFGHHYIRFYSNGAPIVESPTAISAITNANPGVITDTAHGYTTGDWVFISGVQGMTGLINNYYIVNVIGPNSYSLTTLFSVPVDTTSFGTYTGGGFAQRVYTISSPYAAGDLFPNPITANTGLKYVQNVTSLIITHPSYPVQVLTINSTTNWTIVAANFSATISSPTGLSLSTTLATNPTSWSYGYTVTAVDINGQESAAPTMVTILNYKSLSDSTAPGTNTLSWAAVAGAQSYNVYKASPIFDTTFAANTPVGFIANTDALSFLDPTPGIAPDFSQTPPILQNPFVGAGVNFYTVTSPGGGYTTVPSVTVSTSPAGLTASAAASIGVGSQTFNAHSPSFDINVATGSPSPTGCNLTFPFGAVLQVTGVIFQATVGGFDGYNITGAVLTVNGSLAIVGASVPANPVSPVSCDAVGFGFFGSGFNFNFSWGVFAVNVVQSGSGYLSAPTVTFSSGLATATATLFSQSSSNPSVPGFLQERLVLASQPASVQSINMSQPASFFNFNVSFPSEADDAISTQIISSELNDVRSLTQVPTGLLAMTGRASWLLNGGAGISTQDPVTPSNITAQPQGFNGANDLPPIKVNFDVLYGTRKGSYVRDLTYNLYAQIFTGNDISVLSNHLFFNFWLLQWCWSEEPFKTVWAIRNDGILLSLAYVKDQELQGWAHHDTAGAFTSVCSVLETVNGNNVDAVYVVVKRDLGGANYVQYVERIADRYFGHGAEDAWSVDCALQTVPYDSHFLGLQIIGNVSAVGNAVTITDTRNSPFSSFMGSGGWVVRHAGGNYAVTGYISSSALQAVVTRVPEAFDPYTGRSITAGRGYTIWEPVTTVTGLTQLIGQTVTGLADGVVVPSTVVSAQGSVTLSQPATKVTLGLAFTPQLQTLPLDLGEPTVQSKRKKVPALTMRVADTLGLQAGTTFQNIVTIKDFQLGAIPTQSNGPALVTDLYSGDGRQILDQVWQEIGQLCIQQNLPYPATILGVMPEVVVGDSRDARSP